MSTVYCSATVATLTDGSVACVDGIGAAVAWTVQPDFDIDQVLTGEAAGYFGAGFSLVVVCYALGHCLRAILSLLR